MKKAITLIIFTCGFLSLSAQTDPEQQINDTIATVQEPDTLMHQHEEMRSGMGNMSHAFSRNLPMNRNGSGTGWLPDAAPMYGLMFHQPKWMFMLHGNVFFRYNNQDLTQKGNRGDEEFDIPNWLMFMGQRQVGERGLFRFSTMFSLDALISGGSGYPLLFQTGESYRGEPLVDRQHPHDLFSELSISYAHAFSERIDAFIYLGYPGEPALGPVAFMHRPSALYNPDAPLSHHWIDATHITFGVTTLGFRAGPFKVEASNFTGREPDEERFGFDRPRFDSWSGRLSYNPTENWALQVSRAWLTEPETLHPEEDVQRTTASATYSLPLQMNNWLNATAAWGLNERLGLEGAHALLMEAAWRDRRMGIYARYEWVQKSAEELALDETLYGYHTLYNVNAVTGGFNFDLFELSQVRLALGSQLTIYLPELALTSVYGTYPLGFEVFFRMYPALMQRN